MWRKWPPPKAVAEPTGEGGSAAGSGAGAVKIEPASIGEGGSAVGSGAPKAVAEPTGGRYPTEELMRMVGLASPASSSGGSAVGSGAPKAVAESTGGRYPAEELMRMVGMAQLAPPASSSGGWAVSAIYPTEAVAEEEAGDADGLDLLRNALGLGAEDGAGAARV
jgi:hypothetical protein